MSIIVQGFEVMQFEAYALLAREFTVSVSQNCITTPAFDDERSLDVVKRAATRRIGVRSRHLKA